MNIARPATGFLIKEPESFGPYLKSLEQKWPRVLSHWEGIKERLKMTAHKEGEAAGSPLRRVFESVGSKEGQFPGLCIAYSVFADTLTFVAMRALEPD